MTANEERLPTFDPKAKRVTYGPLHGYRWHEAEGVAPAYPFGFGRSYVELDVGAPSVDRDHLAADATVERRCRSATVATASVGPWCRSTPPLPTARRHGPAVARRLVP